MIDDADADVLIVVKQVVNLVYQEIIARYKQSRYPPQWMVDYDDTLTTTHAQRHTNLSTGDKDVERIISVALRQSSSWYPCVPITIGELEASPDLYWNTTHEERPTKFFHQKDYNVNGSEDNKLLWFPLPDAAYTFRYWFDKRFPELVNADDVPKLPPFTHGMLVYGSLVQLAMFDIRVKVGPWAELYGVLMKRLEAFTVNFVMNADLDSIEPWGM